MAAWSARPTDGAGEVEQIEEIAPRIHWWDKAQGKGLQAGVVANIS